MSPNELTQKSDSVDLNNEHIETKNIMTMNEATNGSRGEGHLVEWKIDSSKEGDQMDVQVIQELPDDHSNQAYPCQKNKLDLNANQDTDIDEISVWLQQWVNHEIQLDEAEKGQVDY